MLVKFTVQLSFANVRMCLDPMMSPFGLVGVSRLPLLNRLLNFFLDHFVSNFVSVASEQLLLQSLLLKWTLRVRRQDRL